LKLGGVAGEHDDHHGGGGGGGGGWSAAKASASLTSSSGKQSATTSPIPRSCHGPATTITLPDGVTWWWGDSSYNVEERSQDEEIFCPRDDSGGNGEVCPDNVKRFAYR